MGRAKPGRRKVVVGGGWWREGVSKTPQLAKGTTGQGEGGCPVVTIHDWQLLYMIGEGGCPAQMRNALRTCTHTKSWASRGCCASTTAANALFASW